MSVVEIESETIGAVSRRLLPLIITCYFVAYLDRVNVGFAALQMNHDLGFSATLYGWAAGIFFFGYFLFEVPSNLLLQRFGASRWIARIMITWGLVSAGMAFVSGPVSFVVARFLLGLAEAGFFPGMIYYLTLWFPVRYRAKIVASFMFAIPLSTVIGAPVSGLLLGLDGWMGLKGWQWLFIIEGLPAVAIGLVVLAKLTDRPEAASWLSPPQRDWLVAAMARDSAEQSGAAHRVRDAVSNPAVLTFALIYLGLIVGLYGIGMWLPQIVKGFGLSNVQTGFVTALPYVFGAACMVPWARRSDRANERIMHVALPTAVAAAGFWASGMIASPVLAMVALCVAAIGLFAALPTFWALPTAALSGAGAAAGIAVINSIANLGGFLGPFVIGWIKDSTGGFTAALAFLAACFLMSSLLTLVAGRSARTAPSPNVAE